MTGDRLIIFATLMIDSLDQGISFSNFNKRLSCRYCGLAGESASLVNRRPWVQIPAVPQNVAMKGVFYFLTS